jgi:hypothetical protein
LSKQIPLKKLLLAFITSLLQLVAFSQYWQQKTNYLIEVSLNDAEKSIDGFEKLTYFNNSPDTLTYIWFHLWPNAYKNDKTAFSDQLLENGNTKFYFSTKEERGYINRLDFKVDGVTAKTEDHPQNIDIIKLVLPHPVLPHQQAVITTPFHVKLPFNFSRGGYDGESFQITQWYPKPAVYDRKGWHPIPYLDQGEFYSEFGDFDVRITVPKNYVVAATGELQDPEEQAWLKSRGNFSWQPTKKKTKSANGIIKTISQKFPPSSFELKTIRYTQSNVHDFAWFADKRFIVQTDTCKLTSGAVIAVFSFYTTEEKSKWEKTVGFCKDAIRFYSDQVGAYPYKTVSVVQGPQSFGGGMEYPTITIISPTSSLKELDETIAHELGHNWFYGILATNERTHPWMDEGINSFYENRYMERKYGAQSRINELLFQTKAVRATDQPVETPSEQFSEYNYYLVAYHKTAEWMKLLAAKLGEDAFQKLMHRYYSEWSFKHPYPEDFRSLAAEFAGNQADSLFSLLDDKGIIPGNELHGFQVVSPFKKGSIKNYLYHPSKNTLLLSPALGINSYDKLMAGALISNYKLPPTRFSFLAIPMYGTGSKKFTGLGKVNYTLISKNVIRKTDIFLNASQFTMNEFSDTAGNKLRMQFQKLVPGIRFTFREKDPRATVSKWIQWKTFFITEESLNIIPDSTIIGTDTTLFLHYSLPKESRYLNQLKFVYENQRSLYPFRVELQLEQGKDFIRPALTLTSFFNYREGGLEARFFAGKFIYLGEKTIRKRFDNDRYFLNMSGPNGYEDYTYSDYFVGRNRFEGAASQQMMIRDGAFKVRTDLLADKIGRTDNWLAAINLNSSLPNKLNPLSVLPVKIPLHLFFDLGTYADAWERNSESDHFLYDIGLHIPLADGAFNVYIPVLYNKVYGDYFKSTITKNRFLKTITFSINFYTKSLKKINQDLEF